MIAGFFNSGGVAVLGLVVLGAEAIWLKRRGAQNVLPLLLAGASLLVALLAALRDWPWPWIAVTLSIALVGHLIDLRAR